jgi:hypothetical protein
MDDDALEQQLTQEWKDEDLSELIEKEEKVITDIHSVFLYCMLADIAISHYLLHLVALICLSYVTSVILSCRILSLLISPYPFPSYLLFLYFLPVVLSHLISHILISFSCIG